MTYFFIFIKDFCLYLWLIFYEKNIRIYHNPNLKWPQDMIKKSKKRYVAKSLSLYMGLK